MKRQRFSFRLLTLILFGLFALLACYGMYSISAYGTRWFTYAKNPRVREQKRNVIPGDILDRNANLLVTTISGHRTYQADETSRRAVSHLLGDPQGYVANSVESFQAAYLYGFETGLIERIRVMASKGEARGDNVTLTVDSRLSSSALRSFQRRAQGKSGAVVVMNYQTGEILAMVSLPTFDPEDLSSVSSDGDAFWNRVTQNVYTPGSTFKVITAAALLRANSDAEHLLVECTGALTVDDQVIHDFGSAHHGQVDLREAFSRSCNNAFAQYALRLGDLRLRETAAQFGFGDNFLFRDLVVENSVYPTGTRSDFAVAITGFGQSAVGATPLHLCMIASAVANDGVMMEPQLILNVTSPQGVRRRGMMTRVYRTPLTSREAAALQGLMRSVVAEGTGRNAQVSGLTICGKTGSAETTQNGRAVTNGLFIGYCEELPYALAVVVEDIADGEGGGSTAAPIARDIFTYLRDRE